MYGSIGDVFEEAIDRLVFISCIDPFHPTHPPIMHALDSGEKYFFDFKVWLDKARGLRAVRRPSGYQVLAMSMMDLDLDL